ncbi:UNVERIFIED_CONTAM: Retrovirus-related Pol polyprotein from transposon TNT 1-94 [Sesamum radiatum]|uniref:Retrovirus-related Pol polyprotein from transposon TNT 1-94 n=1 Tax=Sesamum radiatum TaxID=300843 RepID=A0AAW2VLK7_SESRA
MHQKTCAYTPQQNSVVERNHKHLLQVTRSLMLQSKLPKTFWGESILAATYIINRLPSVVLNWQTPYELLYNAQPNCSHLKAFGCLCYATNTLPYDNDTPLQKHLEPVGLTQPTIVPTILDISAEAPQTVETSQTRRTSRTRNPPVRMQDYVHITTSNDPNNILDHTNDFHEPLSYDDAKCKQAKCKQVWLDAMQEEFDALEKNNTWEITTLPSDKRAIGCRWVYKVKRRPDGSVDSYKTRLVAKGYSQVEGTDYADSFSLVAKLVTVRLFLAIAAAKRWNVHQTDINNAFLHSSLDEEDATSPRLP